MIRIVIDTNVVVSGYIFRGIPQDIILSCKSGNCRPLVSVAMINELARVLHYKKLKLTEEAIYKILQDYNSITEFVIINKYYRVIQNDRNDNIFIDCAISGQADAIVSGDKHLLNLGEFKGIKIVKPITFVKDFLS